MPHRPSLPTFAHSAFACVLLAFFEAEGSELALVLPVVALPLGVGATLADRFLISIFFATLTLFPVECRCDNVSYN